MNFSLKKNKHQKTPRVVAKGNLGLPAKSAQSAMTWKDMGIFGRKLGRKKVLGENFLEFLFLVIFPKIVPIIFCEKLCFVSGTTSRLPSFRGNTTRANKKTVWTPIFAQHQVHRARIPHTMTPQEKVVGATSCMCLRSVQVFFWRFAMETENINQKK